MKRLLLLVAGWLALILGVIGIVLPLLPTTPFLLLAAACFSRSSERFYRWLIENRLFGPPIRRWQEERAVSRSHKHKAMVLIAATFGLTLTVFVTAPYPRLALILLAGVLLWVIYRLPEAKPGVPDNLPVDNEANP